MAKVTALSEKNISYRFMDDNNVLSFISAVKTGIRFSLFESLMRSSPFSLNEWSNYLHISPRSMQRYTKEKKAFDSTSTEKILEITMLCKLGVEVFGEKEKFNGWLNRKNVALGGIKPKELLDSSFGIDMLKDELLRIEHGVLA